MFLTRERARKKGNVFFLLSATNSFAFSFLFLKPAGKSGCGLDHNYIVEDEFHYFFFIFFFNYPPAWLPIMHQPTPAVRLNSWFCSLRHHESACLFCIVKLFVHFLLCVCLFTNDRFHVTICLFELHLSNGLVFPVVPKYRSPTENYPKIK